MSVGVICKTRGLKSRYQRLRDRGLLTLSEIAARLDVCPETVREWRQHGLLRAHVYNDVQACLVRASRSQPAKKNQRLEACCEKGTSRRGRQTN